MTGLEVVDDADRWLEGAAIDRSSVLFVIGLGEGHVLAALERRGWRGTVVALEPDGASPRAPLAGVTILSGPDYDGLDEVVRSLEPDVDSPVVVGDPALMRARRDEVVRATRLIVRAWFGARANQEARRTHAGPYLLNSLRNLQAITTEGDAASLVGAFAGLPAVLVAAGPSLDANLPEIVAHRDRVVVVAVDTALRPLLHAGVTPDLVVALDPSDANAGHLTDLPACPSTWLVAEGSLDPEALKHFAGRIFFFRVADHHPWPWLGGIGVDRQQLRAWGSVLTTAFDLALQMGCDPVVFTGADLAFTDGRPYARGTTFEEEWRRAAAWGDAIETSWAQRLAAWPETLEGGVGGSRVRTAPHLVAFRDWIVSAAGRARGRTVVNATGAGTLVGGPIRQARLADALAGQRLSLSVSQTLRHLYAPRRQPVPAPADDVRRHWQTSVGVTAEAIAAAVAPVRPADVPGRPDQPPPAAVTADADAEFLSELTRTTSVRLLTLRSPEQDLLGELRLLTEALGPDEAVVIDDLPGIAMGAQVRHAVDTLLCERPDLWLEYRRFVDAASRLTIIRGGALRHTPPCHEADAAKWDPAHQAIAASLVPIVARHLRPRSVIDVGCGAGYWLHGFAAEGVTDVAGISARTTPLGDLPDHGRRFDVCLCLEVAQRLSPGDADRLIAACTRLSDLVVFSSRRPGVPGSSPHERPLPYWAAAFWRHGYVIDDSLRATLEHRVHFPRSVFDGLVLFRRRCTAAQANDDSEAGRTLGAVVLEAAARVHDLHTQKVWWAVAAIGADARARHGRECPRPDLVPWTIPAARLFTASGGGRVLRFRTGAARWYLSHPSAVLHLHEDGRLLPEVPLAALADAVGGGWARWRDEVQLRSSDGSDPRTNRRRYSVLVPSHVAWAESQPLDDVLHCNL